MVQSDDQTLAVKNFPNDTHMKNGVGAIHNNLTNTQILSVYDLFDTLNPRIKLKTFPPAYAKYRRLGLYPLDIQGEICIFPF